MLANRREPRDDLVAVSDLIFDAVIAGRRLLKNVKRLFHAFTPWRQARKRRWAVVDVVLGDKFVQDPEVALVDFLIKAPHERFVLFSRTQDCLHLSVSLYRLAFIQEH